MIYQEQKHSAPYKSAGGRGFQDPDRIKDHKNVESLAELNIMRKDEDTYMKAINEGTQNIDEARIVDDYIDKAMQEGKSDQ